MKKPFIIGLCGLAGSGKNTVADMIHESDLVRGLAVDDVAFAAPLKRALFAMGLATWSDLDGPSENRQRTFRFSDGAEVSVRTMLQTLGTEWGRNLIHPDIWVELLMRWVDQEALGIQGPADLVIVTDLRFPNEAEAILKRRGEVWLIDRPGVEQSAHASEQVQALRKSVRLRVIPNDGSLEDLRAAVEVELKEALMHWSF